MTPTCHGHPPDNWGADEAECQYCRWVEACRYEPFGHRLACWSCWAPIVMGEGDLLHVVSGGRCTYCGEHTAPPDRTDLDEPDRVDLDDLPREPCPVCSELGACGYDPLGRAFIHAVPAEEDETGG